jgi:hypothetical protein
MMAALVRGRTGGMLTATKRPVECAGFARVLVTAGQRCAVWPPRATAYVAELASATMPAMVSWRVARSLLVSPLAIGIAAVTVLPVWASFIVEAAVLVSCVAFAVRAERADEADAP